MPLPQGIVMVEKLAWSGIVMAIKMWYYNGSGSVITMELKWYDGGFCEWYIVMVVREIL